jgi:hypothetical protein
MQAPTVKQDFVSSFSVFWSSQLRGLLQSLPIPYVIIASALK